MNITIRALILGCIFGGMAGHAGSFFNKDKSTTREYVEDKADYASDMTEAQWYKVKGYTKEVYGKLTNDDLLKIKGKKDRFYGVMLQKYGYTKDEANGAWRKLRQKLK